MANISIKKDFQDGDELFAEQLNLNFSTIEQGVNAGNKIIWQGEDGTEQKAYRGTTEQINERTIIDGQVLYSTETGETFLDVGSERISTGAGNVVAIADEQPTNAATKIWINPDEIAKAETGIPILNEQSNNTDATYSCDYINNITSKSAITVSLTAEQKVGTSNTKVNFDRTKAQVGNNITRNGSDVIIGAGINFVEISAYFNLSPRVKGQTPIIRLFKNDEEVSVYGMSAYDEWINLSVTLGTFILPVVEGDIIKVTVSGNVDNVDIRTASYVTIKEV